MGLKPAEFYDMTWAQYQRYALGYLVRQDREWCRTRSIMWAANSPYSKQIVTPRTYYESIFDKGEQPLTQEEYEQACTAFKLN